LGRVGKGGERGGGGEGRGRQIKSHAINKERLPFGSMFWSYIDRFLAVAKNYNGKMLRF